MANQEQNGSVLEAEKTRVKPPPLYKVLLLNDDYTPMDFVVVVLQTVFGMTLTVTEGNASAITLYESCGFRPFGIEPMAIATPAGFKSKVQMWLRLSSAPGAA